MGAIEEHLLDPDGGPSAVRSARRLDQAGQLDHEPLDGAGVLIEGRGRMHAQAQE
jgi:hypothetical protein